MRNTDTIFLVGSRAQNDAESQLVLSDLLRDLDSFKAPQVANATVVSTSVVGTFVSSAVVLPRGANTRPVWTRMGTPQAAPTPTTVRQLPHVKLRVSRCEGSPLDAVLVDLGQTFIVPGRAALSLVGPQTFAVGGLLTEDIPTLDPNGPWDFWRCWVSYDISDAGALAGSSNLPRLTESVRIPQGALTQARLVPPGAERVSMNGQGTAAAATTGLWLSGTTAIGQFNVQTAAVFASTEIAVPADATSYSLTAAAATRVSVQWQVRP